MPALRKGFCTEVSKADLKLDWCSHAAAKYACEKWHYSGCTFNGKQARVGVWESGRFVGVILFATGACPSLGSPYRLHNKEVCELFRVALHKHECQVSRMICIALRLLKKTQPGLRLVVSFADQSQGHHGGIYQAGGWLYLGETAPTDQYWYKGKWRHPKTFRSRWSNLYHLDLAALPKRRTLPKYRYAMPLDRAMRVQIEPLHKPYPKRAGSIASDAPANQAGEGGAIPTSALCGMAPRLEAAP